MLYGSQLEPNSLDYWSDIDVHIVLCSTEHFSPLAFINFLHQLGTIQALEYFQNEEKFQVRAVLKTAAKIERLDLTIYHNEYLPKFAPSRHQVIYQAQADLITSSAPIKLLSLPKDWGDAPKTWFLLYECAKKLGRNDYLIGLHLLLEALQNLLVLKMVERDQKKGTNIHRFGEGPEVLQLFDLQDLNKESGQYWVYLQKLARITDELYSQSSSSYTLKATTFIQYIEESRSSNPQS